MDLQIDAGSSSGQVTLLVFTPDAMKSRLVAPIERWLREQTNCVPIARRSFSHSVETLDRFYPNVAAQWPGPWQLITRVFTAEPCLATLWFGEDALQVMPRAKGKTEPAHCDAMNVRGRFWCDNGIANLVHVSDDAQEVAREMGVLRSVEPGLFAQRLSTEALSPLPDAGPSTPRHSAILTLCSLVTTLLATVTRDPPRLDVRDDESAQQTMARAEAWLAETRTRTPLEVAGAIEAYLDGTAEPTRFVRALTNAVPVGSWEELVLHCGLLSRPAWLEPRVTPAPSGSSA